jgi:DNA-binding NtrC family response regulator
LAESNTTHGADRQQALRPQALAEPGHRTAAGSSTSQEATRSDDATAQAARGFDAVVERVARSRLSVLITGETGVGKEILARRLHDLSPRAHKPLVSVNCAAFCDNLLESELFGHQRGAFTGAEQARPGLIEAAEGGTLFLDELGELSAAAQAKLLRVIETRFVQRVGAVATRYIDVRFISATNRDFDTDVAAGRFRADLLFRLEGIRLNLLPLRQRLPDILPAAQQFLDEHTGREGCRAPVITEAAARILHAHRWPGNFRELRNVVERAALLCDDGQIQPRDLMLPLPSAAGVAETGSTRDHIIAALKACAGNQTRAARMLGISRRTLITRLATHGIPRPRARALKIVP